MSRLRRCAHLALALLLSIVAVAPHQHDGLAETLFAQETTQIATCEASQTRLHVHTAQVAHTRPCVACVRQHSAGTLHVLATTLERPVADGTFAIAVEQAPAPSVVFTPLRAPPA